MSDPLLKKAIDAVWPRGSAWAQKIGGNMEGLLLGVGDSLELVRVKLSTLASLRNPDLTDQLDELEIDFGVTPDPTLTDVVRRSRLAARINSEQSAGARDHMERELQEAGFDLFVYSNDPAIDPSQLTDSFLTVAGGIEAFAGEPSAVAEVFNATLLVNGSVVRAVFTWLAVAGGDEAFAGELNAIAEQAGSIDIPVSYDVPVDPAAWPFIFFVGGPAFFGGSGELITIEVAQVSALRKIELEQTILRLKPLHTWAVMMVEYN